jgi:Leucine-rich repeat (LRR) protein
MGNRIDKEKGTDVIQVKRESIAPHAFLQWAKLTQFPPEILELAGTIETLIMDFNDIEAIPDMSKFTSLKELSIVANRLSSIHPSLSKLVTLERVEFG